MFLKILGKSILIVAISTNLFADDSNQLYSKVKTKITKVMSLLKDNELKKEQREKKILSEIEALFDYDLIARLSLGKAWKNLDDAKKSEFTKEFTKKLKASYLEKIRLFDDEKIEFKSSVQTKKNRREILSYIIGKSDKKEVLYKFHNSKSGKWLIYDLEVEGISILRTYRSQFATELKNGSIDTLIKKLNAK